MIQPQFKSLPGKSAAPFIKRFLALPFPDAKGEEWAAVFDILKEYRSGEAIIEPAQWKKTLLAAQNVLKSGILTLMIRHIDENPEWNEDWEAPVPLSSGDIVDGYLKDKTTEVKAHVNQLVHESRLAGRDALARNLFGNSGITRLGNYTNARNEAFTRKNLKGFAYIAPLNYLMAYFTDCQPSRELCDLIVIRGHWTSQELSRLVSARLHEGSDVLAELNAFDESLSSNGVYGCRIKNRMSKSSAEKINRDNLDAVFDMVNGRAREIIIRGAATFGALGNHLKALHEDYCSGKRDLLVNWKELESVSERCLARKLEEGYRFLEDFVSLLRLSISDGIPINTSC